MRCHIILGVGTVLVLAEVHAIAYTNSSLLLNSTASAFLATSDQAYSDSISSRVSPPVSSNSPGVGYYINLGVNPESTATEEQNSEPESANESSTRLSSLTVSNTLVNTATLINTLASANGSSSSESLELWPNTTGISSGPSRSVKSSLQGTQFPSSWYALCPELAMVNYSTAAITARVNSSESASACNVAKRDYSQAFNTFRSLLSDAQPFVTSWFNVYHPTTARPNNLSSIQVFTLCDGYPRVNLTGFEKVSWLEAPATTSWTTSTSFQYSAKKSCIVDGTTPSFPLASPACTIYDAQCTALYIDWASSGNYLELGRDVDHTFAGPVNTPKCDPFTVPGFDCSPVLVLQSLGAGVACHGPETSCTVAAGTVQVYYWPPETQSGGLCASTAVTITQPGTRTATISIAPNSTITMTSPTVYVSIDSVSAHIGHDPNQTVSFPMYTNFMIEMEPDSVSSVEIRIDGFKGSWQEELDYFWSNINDQGMPYTFTAKPVNFAHMTDPIPASAYFFNLWNGWWFNGVAQRLGWVHNDQPYSSTIVLNYHPALSVPPQLLSLDPAYRSCIPALGGIYDPPSALTPVSTPAMATAPFPVSTTPATPLPQIPGTPAPTATVHGQASTTKDPAASSTGSLAGSGDPASASFSTETPNTDSAHAATSSPTTRSGIALVLPTEASFDDGEESTKHDDTGSTLRATSTHATIKVASPFDQAIIPPITTVVAFSSGSQQSITFVQQDSSVMVAAAGSTITIAPGSKAVIAGQTISLSVFESHSWNSDPSVTLQNQYSTYVPPAATALASNELSPSLPPSATPNEGEAVNPPMLATSFQLQSASGGQTSEKPASGDVIVWGTSTFTLANTPSDSPDMPLVSGVGAAISAMQQTDTRTIPWGGTASSLALDATVLHPSSIALSPSTAHEVGIANVSQSSTSPQSHPSEHSAESSSSSSEDGAEKSRSGAERTQLQIFVAIFSSVLFILVDTLH